MNGGPGTGQPAAMARARPATSPQVSILAQYIKDLSVENPSAPQVFQWQVQPSLDVQFNINVEKVADDVHEVVLKIEVSARSDNGVHFVVDLSYAGLFGLRNVPEEALPPFLLIEAPRLIFPFARQIIAEAVATPASRRCCSTRSISPAPMWPSCRRQQPQGEDGNGAGEHARRKRRRKPDAGAAAGA